MELVRCVGKLLIDKRCERKRVNKVCVDIVCERTCVMIGYVSPRVEHYVG